MRSGFFSPFFTERPGLIYGTASTHPVRAANGLLPARNENDFYVHSLPIFFATARYLWFNYLNFLTEVGPGVQIPEPYV